jgi:hypothetical protein
MLFEVVSEAQLTGVKMSTTPRSKRFRPNTMAEKFVPLLLVILLVILVAVFVIVGLSLVGVIPAG